MPTVFCYEWEETERGWGSRPDGLSLHATDEGARAYLKAYWDRQPDGPAPDEYDRTTSDAPRAVEARPEIAAWVQCRDRRLWSRQAGIEKGQLKMLDPELEGRAVVEGRALLEAGEIEKAAGSAAFSGKRPIL